MAILTFTGYQSGLLWFCCRQVELADQELTDPQEKLPEPCVERLQLLAQTLELGKHGGALELDNQTLTILAAAVSAVLRQPGLLADAPKSPAGLGARQVARALLAAIPYAAQSPQDLRSYDYNASTYAERRAWAGN